MRRRSIGGSMASLLVLAAAAGACAQAEEDTAGAGVFVEMPQHGYVITFPDDWEVSVPDLAQMEQALRERAEMIFPTDLDLPETAKIANATSLVAYAPDTEQTGEWCLVQLLPSLGRAISVGMEATLLEAMAEVFIALLGENLLDGPHTQVVRLPAAAAVRVDVDFILPDVGALRVTGYLLDNGRRNWTVYCYAWERPEDAWLSIAETIRLLP